MTKRKAISKAMRERIHQKYNSHCAYCGCEITLKEMQVDHIVPVHLGGAHEEGNYNPSCRACNFYKSTLTLQDFRKNLMRLNERLRKVFIFRLAVKYGLVKECDETVGFHFESY